MTDGERVGLVPSSLAKRGFKFTFEGISESCKTCKLRSACVDGLEMGRVYEVVEVNRKKKFPCPLHGEVVLATLRKAHILVALPSGLIEGVTMQYKGTECEDVLCKNYPYCKPDGIVPGDKIKIVREVGPLSGCPKVAGFKIYEVEVR